MRDPKEVILSRLITEKGVLMKERDNKYLFRVAPDANKHEVKRAVEQLFKVHVNDVATMVMRGKTKRFGFRREEGRRPNWKKAVVTLKKDEKIEAFESL
ncbi:MAG TPA: 50S ribosomal protein L23 [candidate division Zixibacteria bacterium]|nr:50S ribosomal protein L23 [candidate division Zixibacteria bacterium]